MPNPDQKFEYYRQLYVTAPDKPDGGKVSLRDLSSDSTGNSKDPSLRTLTEWSRPDNNDGMGWPDLREKYREDMKALVKVSPEIKVEGISPDAIAIEIPKQPKQESLAKEVRKISSEQFNNRYASVVSDRFALGMQLLEEDPKFHSLDSEIALVTEYTKSLLENISKEEHSHIPTLWRLLKIAKQDLVRAQRSKNKGAIMVASAEIARLIDEGDRTLSAWEEVFNQIDRRARLINTESQRRARNEQSVPVADLPIFMELLRRILQKRIMDQGLAGEELMRAIASDMKNMSSMMGDRR